jgi:adenylate kinase family enzyme
MRVKTSAWRVVAWGRRGAWRRAASRARVSAPGASPGLRHRARHRRATAARASAHSQSATQGNTMKIAILGNSGSGKSTLASALAAAHDLCVLDLDTIAWEPGKVAVARDPVLAASDVEAFCQRGEHWVVEGCYGRLVEVALRHSPILLFLEPGVAACLDNCRSRPWEAHKYDSRQAQDARLPVLLDWVQQYDRREGDLSLMGHQSLFDSYAGAKRKLLTRVDESFPLELSRGILPSAVQATPIGTRRTRSDSHFEQPES